MNKKDHWPLILQIKKPIYLIQCNKCKYQYMGETKHQLNERFGEHRRSILNHQQLSDPTPVSLHFNQAGHSINDVILIPLELIRSNRDAVRKAREAHLIHKGNTLSPLGINRRDDVSTVCMYVCTVSTVLVYNNVKYRKIYHFYIVFKLTTEFVNDQSRR